MKEMELFNEEDSNSKSEVTSSSSYFKYSGNIINSSGIVLKCKEIEHYINNLNKPFEVTQFMKATCMFAQLVSINALQDFMGHYRHSYEDSLTTCCGRYVECVQYRNDIEREILHPAEEDILEEEQLVAIFKRLGVSDSTEEITRLVAELNWSTACGFFIKLIEWCGDDNFGKSMEKETFITDFWGRVKMEDSLGYLD